MLVPTVAVITQIAVLPAICPLVIQLVAFSWFRFWDAIVPTLGRVSQLFPPMLTDEQRALVRCRAVR
jgi:hypothetical protein